MKCKYCKYYEFDRRIEACHGHGEIQIGKCNKSGLVYGNLTFAETEGCPVAERWEPKYQPGEVFMGDFGNRENKEVRAFCIKTVQREYYPNIYRIRDNRGSEYSLPESKLDGSKKILSPE